MMGSVGAEIERFELEIESCDKQLANRRLAFYNNKDKLQYTWNDKYILAN